MKTTALQSDSEEVFSPDELLYGKFVLSRKLNSGIYSRTCAGISDGKERLDSDGEDWEYFCDLQINVLEKYKSFSKNEQKLLKELAERLGISEKRKNTIEKYVYAHETKF